MKKLIDIAANIASIRYTPYLCATLKTYEWTDLQTHFPSSAFILRGDSQNDAAISWWVSAKRTRSYPYARIYDTLGFLGKKITVIPIFKDEGRKGDRDYLQWDTISLMSLINVYVIVGYYDNAVGSTKYPGEKITQQRFDLKYIKNKIKEIESHHSSALHWNLEHVRDAGSIGEQAIESYKRIAHKLGVRMRSWDTAEARVKSLQKGPSEFMRLSRSLAEEAQNREVVTNQPKEKVSGEKGKITIQNFLGGYYYLTLDEVETSDSDIHLIEAKHTSRGILPSTGDIKDALIKMLIFTNLESVKLNGQSYRPIPILKLTGRERFESTRLGKARQKFWQILNEGEAEKNGFRILIG